MAGCMSDSDDGPQASTHCGSKTMKSRASTARSKKRVLNKLLKKCRICKRGSKDPCALYGIDYYLVWGRSGMKKRLRKLMKDGKEEFPPCWKF